MYGIDISHYQGNIDLSKGKIDFVIMKATEGITLKDKSFHKFCVQSTELGLLKGCYHFARPDLRGTVSGMEQEAKWFVKVVIEEGMLNNSLLILDWESGHLTNEKLATAWVNRVEELTNITPIFYASSSVLSKIYNWEIFYRCPIWVAKCPTIKPLQAGTPYKEELYIKNVFWTLWQYSSKGVFPGFAGNVDLDYCDQSELWWNQYSGKAKEIFAEQLSDDMKWAIEKELFIGTTSGKYYPQDYLTRQAAASLLRRFYNLIK